MRLLRFLREKSRRPKSRRSGRSGSARFAGVFRSRNRPVVYSQAEHARLSAVIAAAWALPLPLPFASFVRGVELHDRGYGELDGDSLGEIAEERWFEIMRRGFEAQDKDPVVDLVAAMHIRRLVSYAHPAVVAEFDAELPGRREAAGVSEADAVAADVVTNLCDRLSFSFCFEEEDAGTVGPYSFTVAADGSAALAPWPLDVSELAETVVGYRADGYPQRLEAVERVFRLRPA
jgi:hypothetical protein